MRIFSAKQTFNASGEFVPEAMRKLKENFEERGFEYEVMSESLTKTVIQFQRGCIVHQALGLRNGIEITFTKDGENTDVEVRDCLIENQLIGPGLIFYYFPKLRIPIAVTDAIGLALQINLPQKAMNIIDEAYHECTGASRAYCPHCGNKMAAGDTACGACGYQTV